MKNLFKALAEFQQEVPVIHKGTEGYGYSYADLTAIFGVINPLLKNHGLGFTQEMEGTSLKTTIFHVESGEFRESSTDIPQNVTLAKMNPFQVMGSAITYIRRYTLSAALGLVTDKDTDAAGTVTPPAQKAAPTKAPSVAPSVAPSAKPEKKLLDEKGYNYLLEKGTTDQINQALKERAIKAEWKKELETKLIPA